MLANDTDPDGDTLTAAVVTDPAHGILTLNANGSFSYTPAPNYHGPDSFTYRADDGQLSSNRATVNVKVTSVNDPPVAVAEGYVVAEDGKLHSTAMSGVFAECR